MDRQPRITSKVGRGSRASRGALALGAPAAGLALGPERAFGAGAVCVAIGLLGAAGAVWAGSRRPPRRGGERGEVRRELGPELMALEKRGWLVSESVPVGDQSQIDFLVTTPAVSFVIDVAEGRETAAAARLDGHLAWARERYGRGRQIEPVLCSDAAAGSGRSAIGARPISPSRLVPFLLDRG